MGVNDAKCCRTIVKTSGLFPVHFIDIDSRV